jgi:rRNA small subunit pseudouridine methyltransferase Nep1
LLDSNLHYPAMKELLDADRRGRPDIVHACLLFALDTPLNREGLLRAYVHTRHNKLIIIDPVARLPRAHNRFIGLMEYLFLAGTAPPDKPLLYLEDASLAKIISKIKPVKTIAFSERGQKKHWGEFYSGVSKDDDVCIIVGGFPHGSFLSNVTKLSDELVCIDPELLRAPTVIMRAIFAYEDTYGITKVRLARSSNAP